MSIQLKDIESAESSADKLAAMPAVRAVYPVTTVSLPDVKVNWVANNGQPVEPATLRRRDDAPIDDNKDTFAPHVMVQVDKLRAKKIRGKGIKIAVVDTGIDYTHPALGGCFGPGCLVESGYDLVGKDYDADGFHTPQPGKDPMDCLGHGTHVAGIIAAQASHAFNFTGVAPDVKLMAYKVFGCVDSTSTDVLVAAFNRAYEDGAQIITSSIGGPSGWSEDAWAVAASRIAEKGVPVTISASNSGDKGVYFGSSGASGKLVNAVANFEVTEVPFLTLSANIISDVNSTVNLVQSKPALENVELPIYAIGVDPKEAADGCTLPDSTPDLSGKLVLVQRGTCAFSAKEANIAAKGGKYMLVYNNAPGVPISMALSTPPLVQGAAMITDVDGKALFDKIKAGVPVTFKMGKNAPIGYTVNPDPVKGGSVSTSSSWGPTWENEMKPQFGGVGGSILSTYPVALGSYASLSGTSMSCPQLAGIVALIAEVRGTFDPVTMRNLLAANANPQIFNTGSGFKTGLAPVPQQGAGLVQAYDAAFATTLLEPAGLSFNDTAHFTKSKDMKISNVGKESVTYSLSHVPALTVYAYNTQPYMAAFPNTIVNSAATLELSTKEFTLAPGETKTVTVSPTPPQGVDPARVGVWSGYVAINGTDGTSLSIAYQGTTGTLHDHVALASNDDVWFTRRGTDDAPISTNETWVLPAPGNAKEPGNLPYLVHKLATGSRKIMAHLKPMTTCPPKNMTTEFMGEKTIGQPDGFPAFWKSRGNEEYVFTGKLSDGNYAPPGKYKIIVRALRIFGDEKNEHDWDVAESPSFRFKYA